jgi:hypothetical protein
MAYAYVKSGGTATGTAGKYTTAKTGSWSTAFTDVSQYYGSFQSCLTNANLVSGDIIYISNTHNYQYTITSTTNVSATLKNIYCYSVDNTDITSPAVGATEYFYYSGTSNLSVTYGVGYLYGMTLRVTQNLNLYLSGLNNSSDYPTILSYEECTFLLESSSSNKAFNALAPAIFLKCTFNFNPSTNSNRYISSVSSTLYKNCTFIGPSNSNALVSGTGGSYFESCNFNQLPRPVCTSLSYPSGVVVVSKGSEAGTYTNPTLTSVARGKSGKFFKSNVYSSIRYDYGIKIETDPSVYRPAGASWDKITYYSYKVTVIGSNRFKLCEFYKEPIKNQKLEVYLAHNSLSSVLSDDTVRLEFSYVHPTTFKTIYLYTEDLMKDALGSYTNLPGSSEIWVGLSGAIYKQKISLTIPVTGTYGLCSVWLRLPPTANLTVYVCPKAELV